ncbi:MAG: hypothetical protein IJZ88_05550 [Clostridia bacterium]|nr:hypothetical protein [Clostridia bacterium]
MNIDSLENILRDRRTWEEIIKKQDTEFLCEIEISKKDKNFNHCDFQEFIQYLKNREKSGCPKEHPDENNSFKF